MSEEFSRVSPLTMAEGSQALAAAGSVRPMRCLICDRSLDTGELATCADAHATCPAGADVTYLAKVRSAVAPVEWPDGRTAGDLVCPRCAALVNDIVIYESRLADMMQRLVRLVTATLTARTGGSEDAKHSDRLKSRRSRKLQARKNKSSGDLSEAAATETQSMTAPAAGRPRRACQTDRYGGDGDDDESDDVDDPATDDPPYAVEQVPASESAAVDVAAPGRNIDEVRWLVSTEPVTPRPRPRRPAAASSEPHVCHVCHKRLASAKSLKKHLLLHSDQRRFTCGTCGKGFVDSRALRRHEVDHTGVRPFCCSVCGKTLLSSHALKIHQRNHLGIKTDECSVCHKKMSSAQILREHMRIHTGERPYSCEYCGRTFRTEKIMSSHLRTHTGVRPHVCGVCGRSFSQRTPLTAHLRTGHTAAEREACRQERIGRTAIKTADGIVEVGSGRMVTPAPAGSVTDAERKPVELNIPVVVSQGGVEARKCAEVKGSEKAHAGQGGADLTISLLVSGQSTGPAVPDLNGDVEAAPVVPTEVVAGGTTGPGGHSVAGAPELVGNQPVPCFLEVVPDLPAFSSAADAGVDKSSTAVHPPVSFGDSLL